MTYGQAVAGMARALGNEQRRAACAHTERCRQWSGVGAAVPAAGETPAWQDFILEFKAGHTATAVLNAIRRQEGVAPPCRRASRVWLDGFTLQKITVSASSP